MFDSQHYQIKGEILRKKESTKERKRGRKYQRDRKKELLVSVTIRRINWAAKDGHSLKTWSLVSHEQKLWRPQKRKESINLSPSSSENENYVRTETELCAQVKSRVITITWNLCSPFHSLSSLLFYFSLYDGNGRKKERERKSHECVKNVRSVSWFSRLDDSIKHPLFLFLSFFFLFLSMFWLWKNGCQQQKNIHIEHSYEGKRIENCGLELAMLRRKVGLHRRLTLGL